MTGCVYLAISRARAAFPRALSSGLAITEFEEEGRAAEVIKNLWKLISKQL